MFKLHGFTALALAAALLLPSGARAADRVYEYNFQSPYGGPHVLNLQMYQPWIEELKTKSNGRLILHFFMAGTLAKASECGQGILNGNLDFATLGPTYQDTLFPHTLAFTVPHLVKDSVQGSAMVWKAYTTLPEVKAEWDKVGHLLTLWSSDRSGLFSSVGPIKKPADLVGKRVLIWSGSQVDQVKAWGGIPVQVTSNDTYMALQRGMGDVFFGPLPTGKAYKLMEVAKDITILPASLLLMGSMINKDVWEELPKDLQDLIMETGGGEAASIRSGRLLYDATNRDLEFMKQHGCTVHTLTDAEYQAFKDADHDVTTEYWLKELAHLGIKDPAAAIKRSYDLAASVSAAQ